MQITPPPSLIQMYPLYGLIHPKQIHIPKRHHMPIPADDNNPLLIHKPAMPIPRTGLLPDQRALPLVKDDLGQVIVEVLRVPFLLPD